MLKSEKNTRKPNNTLFSPQYYFFSLSIELSKSKLFHTDALIASAQFLVPLLCGTCFTHVSLPTG